LTAFTTQNDKLFLWLCISADIVFIVLHVLYKTYILDSALYSVKRDLGYAEFYQYVKFLWIIILCVYLFQKLGYWGYWSWAMVFLYFLVDDAFQIHEDVGRAIANQLTFTPPLNLRLQDFGEFAVYAAAGIILALGIGIAYQKGSQAFKKLSRDLISLIAILIFFGVFLDAAEIASNWGIFIKEALGLLDDGGELIIVSVMLWYIFQIAHDQTVSVLKQK